MSCPLGYILVLGNGSAMTASNNEVSFRLTEI